MEFVKKIVKGIFLGVANIIPGVSGGTLAVSMGIYDDIIYAITHLMKDFKKSVKMLFPFAIGMGGGIVLLAKLIEYLFTAFPFQTSMAFIGLILGGIPVMVGRIKGKKLGITQVVLFIIFFALIIGLQLLGDGSGKSVVIELSVLEVIKLFFIGVIASATMVVPGVSGSMILLLIGYYNPILEAVNGFVSALIAFDTNKIIGYMGILVPFGIGIVIGIFAIAKLIEFLLKHYESHTFSAILGLIVASPVAILMGVTIPTLNIPIILSSVALLAVGFLVAYRLGE